METPELDIKLEPSEHFDELYWAYNLPLQFWTQSDGSIHILNYMPRKETARFIDPVQLSEEELKTVCANTAKILRNLALLVEAFAERKIKTVYYPNETIEHATGKEE